MLINGILKSIGLRREEPNKEIPDPIKETPQEKKENTFSMFYEGDRPVLTTYPSETLEKSVFAGYLDKDQVDMISAKNEQVFGELTTLIAKSVEEKKNREFWDITTNQCPNKDMEDWKCPVKEKIESSPRWNCNQECENGECKLESKVEPEEPQCM